MGTDNLVTIRAAVRAGLADTGLLFTSAIIDEAVAAVTSDISRLAPRELISVFSLLPIKVTAESVVLTLLDTWYALANKPVDPTGAITVTNSAATTTYVAGTDYQIDYYNGKIRGITGGAIAVGATVKVTYNKSRVGVSLSSLTDLIKVYRVEVQRIGGLPQEFYSWHVWANVLYLTGRDASTQQQINTSDIVLVYYFGEHTKPDANTAGSYPAYLDDIVVKGTMAYSLYSKHRERNLQAITDEASARTSINAATAQADSATIIATLLTNASTALTSMTTTIAQVDLYADTAIVAATLALDTVITKVNTDADGAFDSIAAEYTGVETAVALMATLLSNIIGTDIKVALDAIVSEAALGNAAIDLVQAVTSIYTEVETALDDVTTQLGITGVLKTALDAAIVQETAATTALANIDALHANITTALADIKAIVNTTNGTVEAPLDRAPLELGTLAAPPTDTANSFIDLGRLTITTVNVGADVAKSYSEYALAKVQITNAFIREGEIRIAQAHGLAEEASQRINQIQARVAEGNARLSNAKIYMDEATLRLQWSQGKLSEVTGRLAKANTMIAEGNARHATAGVYVNEALARLQRIDRLATEANTRIAKINARIGEGTARLAMADRLLAEAQGRLAIAKHILDTALGYGTQATEYVALVNARIAYGELYHRNAQVFLALIDQIHQTADRFLADARERHKDYWEHLVSKLEMATGRALSATKQLP